MFWMNRLTFSPFRVAHVITMATIMETLKNIASWYGSATWYTGLTVFAACGIPFDAERPVFPFQLLSNLFSRRPASSLVSKKAKMIVTKNNEKQQEIDLSQLPLVQVSFSGIFFSSFYPGIFSRGVTYGPWLLDNLPHTSGAPKKIIQQTFY